MNEIMQNIKEMREAIKSNDLGKIEAIATSSPTILKTRGLFGTWIHEAVVAGKIDVLKLLINFGLDFNERAGQSDSNPLETAASLGDLNIVKYLLSIGAEMDVSEPERNPLFSAIYSRNIDIVKLLIENGIDIHVKYTGESMKDMDALAFAEERGEKEIAELLKAKV